jgi:hypothetical protein
LTVRQTFQAEISGFLLAVLLIVRISLLGETAKAVSPELGSKAGGRGKQLAEEIASKSLSGDFKSSLLTRESIDFFLMPVFSVRESLAQANHASNTNKEAPIVVQFDATFELNQSIDRLHNFVFARYWVSSELYRMEIIWSEPGAQDLRSHLIPPGLSIQNASGKFWVSNDLMPRFNGSYSMPTEKRPMPFTYRYGDFPISNLRYTDQESSDELTVLAKLRASGPLVGSSITNLLVSSADGQIAVKRTHFEPQKEKDSRSETFEISDQTGHLLKRLGYKYSGRSNELQELSVYTPEQKIIVGFKGEGATVRLNKTNVYQIRQFPLIYGEGGRIRITKYKPVSTGIQVPDRIEIYDGKTNTIFHTVQLSNVRLAGSTPEKVNQDAEQFKNLGGVIKPYYDIISKISKTNASRAGIDVLAVKKLTARCDQLLHESTTTVGERLAAANLSINLHMLTGDDTNALKVAKTYLLMLSTNRMPFALLASGASMIENAAKARRYAQESELLSGWLDMLPQAIDPESALHFSFFALSKNNGIVAMKLLEKFDPQFNTPDEHLERAAIYYLAARYLLLHPELAPSANKNELEHAANESLKEFNSLVQKAASLNSFQETLKKRVDASAKTQQIPPTGAKN